MWRIVIAMAVTACLGIAAARADAWSRPPLARYEGRTIVTGTDLRSRPTGFAACLTDVLAKVSGDATVLADPRLATLRPESLVSGYDYVDRMSGQALHDEEGSSDRPFWLTVRFDPARIDAALRQLGRAPYTGPRPTIVPLVEVVPPGAAARDVTGLPDHLAAFGDAADRVGITILPENRSSPAIVAGALLLRGRLAWSDADHGWVANWKMEWRGGNQHWQVRGVSFDEAYRAGMRGALGLMAGHPMGAAER